MAINSNVSISGSIPGVNFVHEFSTGGITSVASTNLDGVRPLRTNQFIQNLLIRKGHLLFLNFGTKQKCYRLFRFHYQRFIIVSAEARYP